VVARCWISAYDSRRLTLHEILPEAAAMRWWIFGWLVGSAGVLFTAITSESTFGQQVPPRPKAGFCRDCPCVGPGCAQQKGTSQPSSGQQGSSGQQPNSGDKDRSPCGPNPPDKGFVYYKNRSDERAIHAEPSADSESVGTPPNGIRLMYDQVTESGGRRWYHVRQPSGPPGWLPSYDVACERPTNPPPPKPDRVMDCDIPMADTASPGPAGARGFAAGSPCEEYQRQHGPVSFR